MTTCGSAEDKLKWAFKLYDKDESGKPVILYDKDESGKPFKLYDKDE